MSSDNFQQKGHNITSWTITKKPTSLSIIFSSEFVVFIYRKLEKISTAIYMITNFFKDTEPLKTKLRDSGLNLIVQTLSFMDIREENMNVFVTDILRKLLEISTLIDLSFRAGLISEMNYTIIKRELDNISDELVGRIKKKAGTLLLNKEFFSIEGKPSITYSRKEITSSISRDSSSPEFKQSFVNQSTNSASLNINQVSEVQNKGQEKILESKGQIDRQELVNTYNKKTERLDKIINALRQHNEMTVKELSIYIRNCSEKTIQRDLNLLLARGVVTRYGDKRWSKYSLKKK
jgi:DNA-binding transcriptional ArsR family regulator